MPSTEKITLTPFALGFIITTVAVPAVAMLGYWLLLQLLGVFSSIGATGGGTAFWAHIGGFLPGAALIFLCKDPVLVNRHPYHGWTQRRSPTRKCRRIRRVLGTKQLQAPPESRGPTR